MDTFEKAATEMKRQSESPKRFFQGAVGIGTSLGAASFAPLLARAAPFLSEYIPQELAIKGLSKINPKFGQFIKKSMDSGYDFSEIKNFLGEQISESQEKTKESRNIIEQESPELHQFISDLIKQGKKPLEAGALATLNRAGQTSFSKVIDKLIKTHKIPWSKIIESVYGMGETAQQPQEQQQTNMQQPGGMNEQLAQILQVGNQLMQRYRPNG